MIKLDRIPRPVELTTKLQGELTTEFKLTGKSVWNLDFIKKGLLSFSNDKCCYCEANIKEESKYLEVEHFHHKDKYKDEVLEWENLLPSCKKCNGTKNNHDTIIEPIIDPSIVDPKNHLKYWRYRIKGVDDLGRLTVSVLNLNDQDRLVKKRFEIGNAIQDKLEQLNELIDDYINGIQTSTRRKNRVVNGIKNLMKEGLPTAIYSATSATIILTDTEYSTLKSKLTQESLWDKELELLEIELGKSALELGK
ncbi:HNH endonuclease [Echinicola strongylocentroti]|uniref:HNH endonuclease n=1 Tax=Echinicola strongylocentroti TaxID=1795355 RepID=A0A2Z4IH96_9BACT|nr:HNH endonuclease [Echinicola strongylocentroti]AWW30099.1 HNH endonuclease [Echinicola strongylocentroti]